MLKRSPLRIAYDVGLTLAAIVGVACIVTALVFVVRGWTPVVFLSGSMSPAMPQGALAVTEPRPASEIQAGDVISMVDGEGVRITHRVAEMSAATVGRTTFVLKGDANDAADQATYTTSSADVVIFSVPTVGYILEVLQSRIVAFGAGILVGGWVIWHFRPPARPTRGVAASDATPSPDAADG